MTHIPVMVRVVDEVISMASVETEGPTMFGKITSCPSCGGILFYQVVTLMDKTEHATDTDVYCARCGLMCGGIIQDPFNELEEDQESTETQK